jgi:hypothetical protein
MLILDKELRENARSDKVQITCFRDCCMIRDQAALAVCFHCQMCIMLILDKELRENARSDKVQITCFRDCCMIRNITLFGGSNWS